MSKQSQHFPSMSHRIFEIDGFRLLRKRQFLPVEHDKFDSKVEILVREILDPSV